MGWRLVHVAQGESEAIVVRSLLEGNGIKVKDVQESMGRLDVINVDGLGKREIYVPEEKYDEAKGLLDAKVAD